jgi:hypothetical protein
MYKIGTDSSLKNIQITTQTMMILINKKFSSSSPPTPKKAQARPTCCCYVALLLTGLAVKKNIITPASCSISVGQPFSDNNR